MNYADEIKWLKDKVDGINVDISELSDNVNTLFRVVAAQEYRIRRIELRENPDINKNGDSA